MFSAPTDNQCWYYGPSSIATIKRLLRRTLVRLVILFSIPEQILFRSYKALRGN